jgi:glucose-1-phosphate cytidylyltransferase
MKVVILAGGKGTRLREVSQQIPKPMVEIGGRPIIWHIMNHYSKFGFSEFVICLGYKGYMIKDFFVNYHNHNSDLLVDLHSGKTTPINPSSEDWKVQLVDTGQDTMTGGRIKRLQNIIGRERFFVTYGDALCNLNVKALLEHHINSKSLGTVTAVNPQGRFGVLGIDDDQKVRSFVEKPDSANNFINGGFFVLEPEIFDLIEGDSTIFEAEPLSDLAERGQLNSYKHSDFWQCMDTPRDWEYLENLSKHSPSPWEAPQEQ